MKLMMLWRASVLAVAFPLAGSVSAGVIVSGSFVGAEGAPVSIALGLTAPLEDVFTLDPVLEFTDALLAVPVSGRPPQPVSPGSALASDAFVDASSDIFRPFVDPGPAGIVGAGDVVIWDLLILSGTPPGDYPFQVSLVARFLTNGNESEELLGAADGAITVASPVAIPEPSTWTMLAAGLALLGLAHMRRRRVGAASGVQQ